MTRTAREIAATVRASIKAAAKAGDLPADLTYSVRSERGSVDVTITGLTNAVIYGEGHDPLTDGRVYTEQVKALRATVEAIRSAENRTYGDAFGDYGPSRRFYGSVTIADERDAAFDAREKTAAAARRAAKAGQ